VSLAHARRLADAVAHTRPAFLEEPVRPEHQALLGRLVAGTSIPIATGERLYARHEFRPILETGIAIAQPDPSHAGGITEVTRIAALASTWDVQLAPHCPLGPVALAACLQLDLALPDFYAPEHVIDLSGPGSADLRILRDPSVLLPVEGHVPRLMGPGLGIDIDEEAVRAADLGDVGVPRGNPTWSHPDGSFAEW
jgi:galactonate dehydratase